MCDCACSPAAECLILALIFLASGLAGGIVGGWICGAAFARGRSQ